MVKLALAARKLEHNGYVFRGRGDDPHNVDHVQHSVRLMLLTSLSLIAKGRSQVSCFMEDDVLSKLPMLKVFEWTPLEDRDLKAAAENQSVAWVARKFAVHPLVLGCGLCLAGGLQDAKMGHALKADNRTYYKSSAIAR